MDASEAVAQYIPDKAILRDDFITALGAFHFMCSSLDVATDFAIYKFLGCSELQAHLITSGLMFGRKATLLADLIGRSNHERKVFILEAFNAVRANKREIITHGYMWSDNNVVKFLQRIATREATVKEHEFTIESFKEYVVQFSEQVAHFYETLGYPDGDFAKFATAALSLDRKSATSPESPTSNK